MIGIQQTNHLTYFLIVIMPHLAVRVMKLKMNKYPLGFIGSAWALFSLGSVCIVWPASLKSSFRISE